MEDFSLPNEPGHSVEHSVLNVLKSKKIGFWLIGLIIFLSIFYSLFLSAPRNFPIGSTIKIEPGMSLRSLSSLLEKQHIIRSRVFFEFFVIMFGGEKHVISANYFFESKLPVWQIARRIEKGEHNMAPVSVTIPEGFDLNQIGDTFTRELKNFDNTRFKTEAEDLEGYLFPDTYFFLTNADEDDVIKAMNDNFKEKISPFLSKIILLKKTEREIVIMASVIEREAKGDVDREIISGILWKRISIGMPLQVDAALETYKNKGLPKNPIGNPGLKAIKAAIYPQNSSYLYYLHDKNGNIHYAKTFAEHIKNKSMYLK